MLDDLRLAIRGLARRPGFTMVAVVTLALGIGANVAVFSVVRGIMLRPLPYPDEGRLAMFWYDSQGRRTSSISEPEFIDFGSKIDGVESVAAVTVRRLHLGGAEPRLVRVTEATPELLPLLGVAPLAGRFYRAGESLPGGPDVVVISESLRRQLFPDGGALGASLTLAGTPHTIVGVMPAGFAFPSSDVEAYRPYRLDRARPDQRNNHYLRVVARLTPGVDLETVRSRVAAYGRWAVAQYPEYYSGFNASFDLTSLRDRFVGEARTPLLLLFGATSLVLLIACANVANLLLARAEERRRETAVRLALGAAPRHLARQLAAESLVLAALATAAALVLARLAIAGLLALVGTVLPRSEGIALDPTVLAYALAVALATSGLFGLAPMLRVFRRDPRADLHAGVRTLTAAPSGQALRRVLVAGQVALTVVLTAAAALLTRSILALRDADVGFVTDGGVALQVSLPEHVYTTAAEVVSFVHQVEDRARALPGVSEAGVVETVPLWGGGTNNLSLQIEGHLVSTIGEAPTALILRDTAGAVSALGLRVSRGRPFTAHDVASNRAVALVNETFVRTVLRGEDPFTTRVRMYSPKQRWMEIVGVVKDISQDEVAGAEFPQLIVPFELSRECSYGMPTDFALVARGAAPAALADAMRGVVRAVEPQAVIRQVTTLAAIKRESLGDRAVLATLLAVAAGLAVSLAGFGLYGVVALWVGERRRELGLRLALGASAWQVYRLVLGQATVPVVAGLAVGGAASVGLSVALRALLPGVSKGDPVTAVVVLAVLLLATVLAAAVPAHRAAHVDPAAALGAE
jgi:putative ABC transport system permease protein